MAKYYEEYVEEVEHEEVSEFEEEEVAGISIEGEQAVDVGPSIVLSVTYDGNKGKALVKLYSPYNDKVYFWYDNTGHKPYLLTNVTPEELVSKYHNMFKHPGFDHIEVTRKFHPLELRDVTVTRIVAKDPLAVGGSRNSIRNIVPQSWESRIKYHHSYIFDRGIIPGAWYVVKGGNMEKARVYIPEDVKKLVYDALEEPEERELAHEWVELLQAPIPNVKRLAIDIEVYTPMENKVPDPEKAEYEVISVALVGNDGLRRVLLLVHDNMAISPEEFLDKEYEVLLFGSERELLEETFRAILGYPIVVTFNGDSFDLAYLYNRALQLGFKKEEIPIVRRRDYITVPLGIHIDLYKFFSIKAIEVYAFGGKYRGERGLDAIAQALVGLEKIERRRPVSEMSYVELADYNYRDAFLTLYLTTFNSDLVMRLIFLLSRISKIPPEDLNRSQVSAWIRNMMYYEHRKRNWVIPNKEDIVSVKGQTRTHAIIKGKKYQGAIVLDPLPGIYFNVYVFDFASLYPSVIKNWNLSYEVINAPNCNDAREHVPGLGHSVCMDRRGLTSLIVGLLRDLRVNIYKKLAKNAKSIEEKNYYDTVQNSMKVLINASYGVFGAETFPLYCPPLAELTTAIGRYVMGHAISTALKMGLVPIYGDTDSLFVWNPPKEFVDGFVRYVENSIGIDIELDKTYRYVAFSSRKKNYLGVLYDGSVDVKGMMGKKRNTPEFVKEIFSEVLDILKAMDSVDRLEDVRTKIGALVRRYDELLRTRGLTLDKLAIKVSLNKDIEDYTKNKPQHVKAAEMLKKYGVDIGRGSVIAFVKTSDPNGVKPVQLARIDEVDTKKYVEYLENTLEQVLEAFGLNFEQLRGAVALI